MPQFGARRRRRARQQGGLARWAGRLSDAADWRASAGVAAVLLFAEACLCAYIIVHVPYTEIDYATYLQQVDTFEQGERDYRKIRGDSGPVVYPAGHLYVYSLLRQAAGGSVRSAQVVFAVLYLATQGVVMLIYAQTRAVPPWSLALLCLSRRLHSIYLLRLFNDCWAMFIAYCATALLQRRRWVAAVMAYSLAVSVKMNILLMAPGVLAVLIKGASPRDLFVAAICGALLQVVLGAPFLLHNPSSYLSKAFEFSRVFMHKWTVNWSFVPEGWFVSQRFGLLLLAIHVRLLWSLSNKKWFCGQSLSLVWREFADRIHSTAPQDVISADVITFTVFSSNLIGILCSRTLHYQFYSWYFHTMPYLLLRAPWPKWQAIGVLLVNEFLWNLFPPTAQSSFGILMANIVVAAAVFKYPVPSPSNARRLGGPVLHESSHTHSD